VLDDLKKVLVELSILRKKRR